MAVKQNTQQQQTALSLEDVNNGGVSCEDFSVDDLLDFSNDDVFVEDDGVKGQEERYGEESNDFSSVKEEKIKSISELVVPARKLNTLLAQILHLTYLLSMLVTKSESATMDVMMKVMSFSQQDSRAMCILSANGPISNVTLQQLTSCGGTLTYEGHFEILSLSGSHMATDSGGTKSRSGGMSVSLADPDGHVFGGGLTGLLVAAGPMQIRMLRILTVVIDSFILGHHQQEQKAKKHIIETPSVITTPTVNVISVDDLKVSYGGIKPMMSAFAFPQDNSASPNSIQGFRNSVTENKTCSPTQDSRELSQSNCEISS